MLRLLDLILAVVCMIVLYGLFINYIIENYEQVFTTDPSVNILIIFIVLVIKIILTFIAYALTLFMRKRIKWKKKK